VPDAISHAAAELGAHDFGSLFAADLLRIAAADPQFNAAAFVNIHGMGGLEFGLLGGFHTAFH
jgi:hypothetical protein